MSKPRVLVITPRLPYPLDKGDRIRIYKVCESLAGHFRLTLLSLCETQNELSMPLPDEGIFESIERVLLPRWRSHLNCILALPSRVPLQVAYYRSSAFARRVAALAPEHDAVICHLVRTSAYALNVSAPRFLEMTDAISMTYARMKVRGRSLSIRKLMFKIDQRRMERLERSIVDHFERSVLVSDVDRRFLFADDPGRLSKVLICGNGVDTDKLAFQYSRPTNHRIIFIGNMTTVPNMDAVEWFAATALPLIRRSHPSAVLQVIGYIEDAQRDRISRMTGIEVVGSVSAVSHAAEGAAVAVCPVRIGAGIQNKLLEYMALGIPAVTTSIGLEGLGARDREEVIVADSADQIAAAVCELLESPPLGERLAKCARKYVESNHRWEDQMLPLLRTMQHEIGAQRTQVANRS